MLTRRFNDSNGVPAATAIRFSDLRGWQQEVDGPAFTMKTDWVDHQKVDIPSPGKYLVLSNYRIKIASKNNGFVKARVMLGSAEVGKVKMITERMHPTRKSFINFGGKRAWSECHEISCVRQGIQLNRTRALTWNPTRHTLVQTLLAALYSRADANARICTCTHAHSKAWLAGWWTRNKSAP